MKKSKYLLLIFILIIIISYPTYAQHENGHYWGDDPYASLGAWIFVLILVGIYSIVRILSWAFPSKTYPPVQNPKGESTNVITRIDIFSKGDNGVGTISLKRPNISILNVKNNLPIDNCLITENGLLDNSKLGQKDAIQIIFDGFSLTPNETLYLSIYRYSDRFVKSDTDILKNNVIRYYNSFHHKWVEGNLSHSDIDEILNERDYYKNRTGILEKEELKNNEIINLSGFNEGEYTLQIKSSIGDNYAWKSFVINGD